VSVKCKYASKMYKGKCIKDPPKPHEGYPDCLFADPLNCDEVVPLVGKEAEAR